MSKLFHGLSAFPITPADAAGRVDTAALSRMVGPLVTAGVDSIGLLGSTGTYAYLERTERQRAIVAAREAAGTTPLITGIGALRTDAAQALTRDAQEAGADGLLLAPVSYTPLTPDEVFEHFVAVAGETDLPLCIYNNPGTTRFTFDLPLLTRLASVSNIVAVKMPLPATDDVATDLAGLRAVLPEGFAVGYSGDWGCSEALLAGADAWFSVVGGLLPAQALALTRAAQQGDRETVQRLEQNFQPLWALLKQYGGVRVMYAAANLMGLTEARPPRPILPLDGATRDQVRAALDRLQG